LTLTIGDSCQVLY